MQLSGILTFTPFIKHIFSQNEVKNAEKVKKQMDQMLAEREHQQVLVLKFFAVALLFFFFDPILNRLL